MLKGKVHKYGADVNTDVIIPAHIPLQSRSYIPYYILTNSWDKVRLNS